MRINKVLSFSVVILLITVLFASAVTVPAAAQYDTMQFRYNAAHSGDYSSVAGIVPSNGKLKWNFTTGSYAASSPAIANGVVYAGSDDFNVYALNATSGAKLWAFPTGGTVDSSPAVANGVVYVGSNDGNLYALYANNGTKLWNYTTGGPGASSPAVANGVVCCASAGNVYALNASYGTLLWRQQPPGGPTESASPAVANGSVYIGTEDSRLYANNGT